MSPEGPEAGDGELEELLRRVPAETPDPRRREAARRAFLAGGEGSQERRAPRMERVMPSDPPRFGEPAPEASPAFEAWRQRIQSHFRKGEGA